MLKITKGINLKDFSGMRVAGNRVGNLYEIEDYSDFEELLKIMSIDELQKMVVVGEGSNMVFLRGDENLNLLKFTDKKIWGLEDKIRDKDIGDPKDEGRNKLISVGAGVNWDYFVEQYMKLGGVGMESLSAIPGTVGAAPVQNIGAYGHDVSEFISSVYAYDIENRHFHLFSKDECEFSYRDSRFKRANKNGKNQYIIFSVIFEIKKGPVVVPEYNDVKKYFENKKIDNLTAVDIREAIIEIRKKKLPDPSIIPNCGSFFKNPIINRGELEILQSKFPEIPVYPVDGMRSGVKVGGEFVKIPIAYIIEKIGLKGYNSDFSKGNFGIHTEHALIVISNGKGEANEFLEFVKFIKQKVLDASGLVLEEEVNLI